MGSRDRGGSTTHQNRPSWSKISESKGYAGMCAAKHHVYFYVDGSLMNDISAVRVQDGYNHSLAFLKDGDGVNASKHAGIMTLMTSQFTAPMILRALVILRASSGVREDNRSSHPRFKGPKSL